VSDLLLAASFVVHFCQLCDLACACFVRFVQVSYICPECLLFFNALILVDVVREALAVKIRLRKFKRFVALDKARFRMFRLWLNSIDVRLWP